MIKCDISWSCVSDKEFYWHKNDCIWELPFLLTWMSCFRLVGQKWNAKGKLLRHKPPNVKHELSCTCMHVMLWHSDNACMGPWHRCHVVTNIGLYKSWDLLLPFWGVNILTKVNDQPLAHHDGWMVGGQVTFFHWVLILGLRTWRKKHGRLPHEKQICPRSSTKPGRQKILTCYCAAPPLDVCLPL
jgi:hypothetical protein